MLNCLSELQIVGLYLVSEDAISSQHLCFVAVSLVLSEAQLGRDLSTHKTRWTTQ